METVSAIPDKPSNMVKEIIAIQIVEAIYLGNTNLCRFGKEPACNGYAIRQLETEISAITTIERKPSHHTNFIVINLTKVEMISRFPICLTIYGNGQHLLQIWPWEWIYHLNSDQEDVSCNRPVGIKLTIIPELANCSPVSTPYIAWR
jgi:hypothetical protein